MFDGINIFQISSSWSIPLSATVSGLGENIESLKLRIFILLNQKNVESLEFWIKRRINLRSINPEVDWVADIDGRTFIIFLGLSRPPPSLHIFSTQAGGVMAISASQFETVDGFSNGFLTQRIICQQIFLTALLRFFGWGGEDDDFFQRLASKVFWNSCFWSRPQHP